MVFSWEGESETRIRKLKWLIALSQKKGSQHKANKYEILLKRLVKNRGNKVV